MQWKYAPPEHHEILAKWWRDGGDARFRYDYPLTPDSLVLDLGGYKGDWTAEIFRRYECKIAVFEPADQFATEIEDRFFGNPKISINRFGLGGESREETLFLAEDGSSIFLGSGPSETIRIIDVVDWFNENPVERVSLLKINIEGEEYALLERMLDTGLIGLVDHLQVQFHPLAEDSETRLSAILDVLGRTHQADWRYPFVWESWSRR